MKDKINYRDYCWCCTGIIVGIFMCIMLFLGVYTIFITSFHLNIGQVIIDINETKMVEAFVNQINNTVN